LTSRYQVWAILSGFESEPGSIPVVALVETRTAWGAPAAGEPAGLFFASEYRASQLAGISAGIGSNPWL